MKQSLLSVIFFCHLFFPISSQTDKPNPINIFLNGNFQIGFPLNQFRENVPSEGFGGGGLLLVQFGHRPIYGGIDLSGMTYDRASVRFSEEVGGFVTNFELITNANIFLGHFVLRFQPNLQGFIQPYVDGMIGTKNLFTRTNLIDRDAGEDNVIGSNIEQGDWVLSYGGALGLRLLPFKDKAIAIDLRCAYYMGGHANYMVKRPEEQIGIFEEPIEVYDRKRSTTTLLIPQIGFTLNLSQLSRDDEEANNE